MFPTHFTSEVDFYDRITEIVHKKWFCYMDRTIEISEYFGKANSHAKRADQNVFVNYIR